MSSFVLVHGAWHGSWCWKRVRTGLQARGHEVFTPTLTGVADRSHLLSRVVNLETHIQDVVNLIRWEELTDIVLCGHSYGGCVISGVADRMPEHIRALVYLDAFVLEDGENQMQHLTEMQSHQFRESVKNLGEGWKVPPIPAAVFNVNIADREWVDRQCTMQPIGTMEQPLSLTGGIQKIKNVTFILATGYTPGSPFPPFYEKAEAKGWQTRTVPCGHDVMLDLPEELTTLLIEARSSFRQGAGRPRRQLSDSQSRTPPVPKQSVSASLARAVLRRGSTLRSKGDNAMSRFTTRDDSTISTAPRPPIEVRNETVIRASVERVWDLLTDVERWPSWYRACRWVRVESPGTAAQPLVFRWKAHPVELRSAVVMSDRPHSFDITADAVGLHAERTFTLRPTRDGLSTVVVSHETQVGLLPWLGRAFLAPRLHAANQAMFDDLIRAASH